MDLHCLVENSRATNRAQKLCTWVSRAQALKVEDYLYANVILYFDEANETCLGCAGDY